VSISIEGIRAIVLDIEGTTTSISFVSDVLFPYARARLGTFLMAHAHSPAIMDVARRLREEREQDRAAGRTLPPWNESTLEARMASVEAYAAWLMDLDRKSTGLKDLQGRIWYQGYERGELKGQVFDDVPGALEAWRRAGLVSAIYSSGSVLAQRLLFGHTQVGDLTPWLAAYFDTTTGAKTDPASYHRIAASLAVAPGTMLFVSDALSELGAARSAGVRTALCRRPGNRDVPDAGGHPSIGSFKELQVGPAEVV
jgi:enolase-phosphatase E1